jgi:Kef-type K+ transport system membrane component KefB
MNLFFILLVLLVVTRAAGELAGRLGQPAIVGELISGVLLGILAATQTETFPYLANLHNNAVFNAITDLGIFFLMMYAGIEMQPQKILKYSKSAIFVAIGDMFFPLLIGIGLGWLYLPESDAKIAQAFFLGTALAITAVPATVKILMDLGKLDTPAGQIIVSAAVFDDLLSLVLLAWLTALISTGVGLSIGGSFLLAAKIILFFVITVPIGYFVWPWGGQFMKNLKERELELSAMLI